MKMVTMNFWVFYTQELQQTISSFQGLKKSYPDIILPKYQF